MVCYHYTFSECGMLFSHRVFLTKDRPRRLLKPRHTKPTVCCLLVLRCDVCGPRFALSCWRESDPCLRLFGKFVTFNRQRNELDAPLWLADRLNRPEIKKKNESDGYIERENRSLFVFIASQHIELSMTTLSTIYICHFVITTKTWVYVFIQSILCIQQALSIHLFNMLKTTLKADAELVLSYS